MNFNSLLYVGFFILVFAFYWILPKKIRPWLLLIASYVFYMMWNVALISVIMGISLVTYLIGKAIGKSADNGKRKSFLILGILLCFGTLFVFKYLDFVLGSAASLISLWNKDVFFEGLDIVLPVGISFYTFQAVSYLIDVYRGEEAEKNALAYFLYLAFFPQLVAGPIERAKDLIPQLMSDKKFDSSYVYDGLPYLISGFFKKVALADIAAIYVNQVYGHFENMSGGNILLATLLFSVEIYCDFAGYSEIAIGSARMLGIKLTDNFHQPYFACGIHDFWDRWHITLTHWFRDYLYIPMGGNRKGKARKYLNILIVFLVSGLWHGAAWTFVFWGLLHGVFLIIENILKDAGLFRKTEGNKLLHVLGVIGTFLLVSFTWIFFRSSSLSEAFLGISRIFTSFLGNGAVTFSWILSGSVLIGIILLYFLPKLPKFSNEKSLSENLKVSFIYALFTCLIVVAWLYLKSEGEGSQFIYFQF